MMLTRTQYVFEHAPTSKSFADLPSIFYTHVPTTPLKSARLLHVNKLLGLELGLFEDQLQSKDFLDVVSGAKPLKGCQPLAAVYSGHQFGVWAGQLGDGRAHYIGELSAPNGPHELQLKGAGQTPYSRSADGRAVLRSSVREYLASEAMFGLGIPTTRALSLVTSDDPVIRETVETAAIVARVSPSFIRFGSFEHWASKRDVASLKQLADFVIERYYPECLFDPSGDPSTDAPYARFFQAVVQRTATLIAQWQTVGFCHGVMNTDNMSILGLTLDYGPYGFIDGFDARHICNHSDHNGRYAWYAQPGVAKWNLYCLANSLSSLVASTDELSTALQSFDQTFATEMKSRMMAKLGLTGANDDDDELIDDLFKLMHENRADFTLCFRELAFVEHALSHQAVSDQDALDMGWLHHAVGRKPFYHLFTDHHAPKQWVHRYLARIELNVAEPDDPQATPFNRLRVQRMLKVNPLYVLRNHLAQKAIVAAQNNDSGEISTLLSLLSNPYVAQAGMADYAQPPQSDERSIAISCSS